MFFRENSARALAGGEEIPWEGAAFSAPAAAACQMQPDILSHILRCDFGPDR